MNYRGRLAHLNRDSQRRIDGQVQPGLEESILEFHSFTLGCQVCEWITGKPSAIPRQQGKIERRCSVPTDAVRLFASFNQALPGQPTY